MKNKGNYRHGFRPRGKKSSTYRAWSNMKDRCQNKKHRWYARYGGRGISVCERWQSFELFLEDMGEKPKGLTLDRIDNDGDYEPGNCRWADFGHQNRNRGKYNRRFGYLGFELCLFEWARFMNVLPATLWCYLRNHNIKEAYDHYVGPVCFLSV